MLQRVTAAAVDTVRDNGSFVMHGMTSDRRTQRVWLCIATGCSKPSMHGNGGFGNIHRFVKVHVVCPFFFFKVISQRPIKEEVHDSRSLSCMYVSACVSRRAMRGGRPGVAGLRDAPHCACEHC